MVFCPNLKFLFLEIIFLILLLFFLVLLLTNIFNAPKPPSAKIIDEVTPPAPSIKAFFPFVLNFNWSREWTKPPISVLWPRISLSTLNIVFTDCVLVASTVNLSKKGIIDFLKGTVTFIPEILSFLTSVIIFFKSFSDNCFYSYWASILYCLNQ